MATAKRERAGLLSAALFALAAASGAMELWPQAAAFPDASKIALAWSGDGYTTVTGAPGAAPAGLPVLVLCADSGGAAHATADAAGAFKARLPALPGSWVVVKTDASRTSEGPRWIRRVATPVSDVPMVTANAAPGAWLRVPAPGDGRFRAVALAEPDGLDILLTGAMSGRFEAGGEVTVEGEVEVFVSSAGGAALAGSIVRANLEARALFDEAGRARSAAGFYFSNLLTPTGLPVETKGPARPRHDVLATAPLILSADGRLRAPFRWTVPLPEALPSGTYALALRARVEGGRGRRLAGLRSTRQVTLTGGAAHLPPFRLGRPAPPRLTWTLLTDVPGADGSRGAVAAEDASDFQLAAGVVTQSHAYIIPKDEAGTPLTYVLEPYLPMVSQGDRHAPNAPILPFRFPSGRLTVSVRRPDGKVDMLGSEPFQGARSRAPATAYGLPLNDASGSLVEVFQLTTASRRFHYRFPLYGRYEIEMEGAVEDAYGNAYLGGGRYTVFVAKRLDLEPATLPMTPLEVGDALAPGMSVLPGVPAEVEVEAELLEGSDPARARRWSTRGRASRFGYFSRPAGEAPWRMSAPGEFVVRATARHTDADGTLWMGALRWGQVVASTGAPVLARGRRGRHETGHTAGLWFESSRKHEAGHMRYPYAGGDVIWQSGDDCIFPSVTLEDREGRVAARLAELAVDRDGGGLWEGAFDERERMGELPLPLVSTGPLPPAARPRDVSVHGYFYAAAERSGERAREVISDDEGVQKHGYWLFNEPYAAQAGIGAEGDRPNDFKFLYGGTVFRDRASGLARYGIYGALWVHLPDQDARGTRIFPPFQGKHGGPGGGPLMTLADEGIDAFVVPLAVRPGTVLETGDVFSFSAALAPTLPASVEVLVEGPGGFRRRIEGRANAVGYFHRPEQDFTAGAPGRYRVSVEAVFDVETSAGPVPPPYPRGSVLGAARRAFDVYVAPRGAPALGASLPRERMIERFGPVALPVTVPGGGGGTLRYTIAMPGFLLAEGSTPVRSGAATILYDPVALGRAFPNIDVGRGRADGPPGLADTVWIGALAEGTDGRVHARHFTLQGPELNAP